MLPANLFGSHFDNLELYPRRRATEFYCDPQPLEEYQSRQTEHPDDKLQNANNFQDDSELKLDKERIKPPRNSAMRIFRNSYFS